MILYRLPMNLGICLSVLSLLLSPIQSVVNQCDSTMKYCSDTGYFDPIVSQQHFEGSIGLFQNAFFNTQEEVRTEFLNPNPSNCAANGYSESQLLIQTIQQLGNNENDFDGNDNLDLVHTYNLNKSPMNYPTFIGNIISFSRCAYIFNFVYNTNTQTKDYNIQKYTISIEYQTDLLRKRTTFSNKADFKFSQSANYLGYNDFPCKVTQFYYHPGLKGIMYLMDDNDSLIIKLDRSFPAGADVCTNYNLFSKNSTNIGQYKVSLRSLLAISDHTITKISDQFMFLNETLFIMTYGISNDASAVNQSRIFKVSFTVQNLASITPVQTLLVSVNNTIQQIAAFELEGLVVTFAGQKGYTVYQVNTATYSSIKSTTAYATGDYWKIYQSRVDNHMHRPIWGVNSSYPSAISRITTTYAQVLNDETNKTDFYNFEPKFSRFHALLLNPGTCSDLRNTTDYNNMKAVLVNLRRYEIEKCISQSMIGCGDGKLKFSNDEQCDDGNLNDGDGCSSSCQIEEYYTCTQVEDQTSVCTPIICGNKKQNTGEECDDGNSVDNDGCSSTCIEEKGWDCLNFTTCKFMCGDGLVYQQNKTYDNGTSYIYYEEQCDGVKGCDNTTCTPLLGWTCVTNYTTWKSKCTQTCGNLKHDNGEVCDDGNNLSGDGCAAGCKDVEFPYLCPLVGKCNKDCGNGIFQGNDTAIGVTNSQIDEECDDGNNINGDGCSGFCKIEVGFTCVNRYLRLEYELPVFKSFCKAGANGGNGSSNVSFPQYYRMIPMAEYQFTGDSVNFYANSGRFRLIEYGDNLKLYGVSLVYTGMSYEYIKVKQLESGSYTYFEQENNGISDQNSANPQYYGYQRGTFGQFYVRNKNQNSLEFYGLLPVSSSTDITFQKFYTTETQQFMQFLGNHEILWWPYQNTILARQMDGANWKGYKFTQNVVGAASSPSDYGDEDKIEKSFKRQFTLDGKLQLTPVFYDSYIISYVSNSISGYGKLRIHKYYADIDYLAPYNEEVSIHQEQPYFSRYSLVFFSEEFGVVFKMAGSSIVYKFEMETMSKTLSPTLKDNGIANITTTTWNNFTMIQSRQDPFNPEEERPVYGYFSNQNCFYRLQANVAANTINLVEKINIPALGVFLHYGLIDVGKYQIAVYSGADCSAQNGTTPILGSSTWFYTISTKTWSCMDMNNYYMTDSSYLAWTLYPSQTV